GVASGLDRAARRGSLVPERHGGLGREDRESHALLQIELHALAVMLRVADGEVLADRQLEVPAARAEDDGAIDRGRPDDPAIELPHDQVEDGIPALVRGLGQSLVAPWSERDRIRSLDTLM